MRDARIYYRVGNSGSLANRRSHKATAALFASKAKCIGYLLALEDSDRTRAASLHLLREWMFHLCEYQDVVDASQKLAAELGGTLGRRKLKAKYKPIEWLFGYDAAFNARRALFPIRGRIECAVDRLLYRLSPVAASDDSLADGHARRIGPIDRRA